MKIDVSQVITNIQGEPMIWKTKENQVTNLTLSIAIVDGVLAMHEDDKNVGGEEKLKRYLLAKKVYAQTEVDLAAEEIAMIKRLVGRAFYPNVVGPVFQMLEGLQSPKGGQPNG